MGNQGRPPWASTTLSTHTPLQPRMCPQARLGSKHHPSVPPPKFCCPVPRRWGPVAVLGAARRGLLCPERKVGAHFGGGHMGLSPLLPSRKAMGLPQRFRERPFPAGTSPRKTIPGREPRASTVLPGASTVGTGKECPRVGEPPQLHPMKRGDPCSCSRPQAQEEGGEAGNHPPSIFLPFTGKSLQPSTPPVYRESLSIHPPTTLCRGETPSSPTLFAWGIPLILPLSPHRAQPGWGHHSPP